jgi:hypothetical protein
VSLVVDGPDVLLETNTAGEGNWQLGEPAADTETVEDGVVPRPYLRKLDFTDARFAFLNGGTGDRLEFSGDRIHAGVDAGALAVGIDGAFNDIPLELAGRIDDAEFMADNEPTGLTAEGRFGDIGLTLDGQAGPLAPSPALNVNLAVTAESAAAFSPLAGRTLPGIGPLSIAVALAGKDGVYSVEQMQAAVDDENLNLEVMGSLADLNSLAGLELEATAATGSMTTLLQLLGM